MFPALTGGPRCADGWVATIVSSALVGFSPAARAARENRDYHESLLMPHRRAFLIRALVVLGAIAACAWFAIGVRQARGISQATAILSSSPHLSAAQAARARGALNSARFLNPDTTVDLLRAEVAQAQGNPTDAARIISTIVRKEPKNLDAWVALARDPPNHSAYVEASVAIDSLVATPSSR
jgi:hypothetical protein